MSVERNSGSVCRELESVCSEREIKRDRERMCMSITIEIESVCVERKTGGKRECVENLVTLVLINFCYTLYYIFVTYSMPF